MNITETDISVVMIRDDLENIPQFALPTPYQARCYQPGDVRHLLIVLIASVAWLNLINSSEVSL